MEEGTYISKKGHKVDFKIDWGLSVGYEDALEKLHPELEWKHEWVGSYQGSIISIAKDKEGNFYYKNNAFGSCSGCDWVEGINDTCEAVEFFKAQETIIKLGKDKEKVIEYLEKEIENCWDFEQENLDNLKPFIQSKKSDNN